MKLPTLALRTAPRAALPLLAVLATAACLALPHPAQAAIPGDATHALPPLEEPAAAGWWAAFGEDPLNQLMTQAGAPPSPTAQNALVQAYLLMRVQQVRLGLATELLKALQTERELLRGQSPTRDVAQAISLVDQRQAYAESLAANFTQLRNTAATQLVQHAALEAGEDKASVRAAVATALSQEGLPEFRAEVPERLPATVLLSRDDVASLRGELAAQGQGQMSLTGWIGPANTQPATAPLEQGLQARSSDQTLRQAGLEVSWSLRQLAEARAAAAADAQRMAARRLEVVAARQRAELGDVGPTDVLEVYLRFLGDADRAAQSQGTLALAWAALHRQAPGTYEVLASARR